MRTSDDVRRSMIRYAALALGSEWEVRGWGTEGEMRFPFARVAVTVPPNTTGPAHTGDVTMSVAVHAYPEPKATPEESLIEVERVKELLHVAFHIGFEYEEPLIAPFEISGQGTREEIGVLPTGTYHYGVSAVAADGAESLVSADVPVLVKPHWIARLVWSPVAGAKSYRIYRGATAGGRTFLASTVEAEYLDTGTVAPSAVAPPVVSSAQAVVRSAAKRVPLYDYSGVPLDGPDAFSLRRRAADFIRVIECPIDQGVDPEDETAYRVIAQARVTWRRTGRVPSGHKIVQEVRLRNDPVS